MENSQPQILKNFLHYEFANFWIASLDVDSQTVFLKRQTLSVLGFLDNAHSNNQKIMKTSKTGFNRQKTRNPIKPTGLGLL